MKHIKNIVGPNHYDEFIFDGKNIALFGEYHKSEQFMPLRRKNSVTFPGFLKSLVTQNMKTNYDFFIEIDMAEKYTKTEFYDNYGMLQLIQQEFAGCLDFYKECPFNNFRAHYADVRSVINFDVTDIGRIFHHASYNKPKEDIDFSYTIILLQNPMKEFIKIRNEVYSILKSNQKIQKQIQKIKMKIKIKIKYK